MSNHLQLTQSEKSSGQPEVWSETFELRRAFDVSGGQEMCFGLLKVVVKSQMTESEMGAVEAVSPIPILL